MLSCWFFVFGTVKVDGAGYEHDGPVAMLVGKVCGYGANGVWLYVVLVCSICCRCGHTELGA